MQKYWIQSSSLLIWKWLRNVLSAKKIPQEEKVLLDKASKVLEQEQLLVYGDSLTEEEKEQLKKMGFVTARPQMYVLNIEESTSKIIN